MLDAPVSGGVLAAETGTLTFMVCSIIFEMVLSFHSIIRKFILARKTGLSYCSCRLFMHP